jgi:FAD/FMN-containing dehydrogenase
VITGDGRFLQNVSRTNEADLFHALSASYGTHAILTRVAVRLEPAPYVVLFDLRLRVWFVDVVGPAS